MKKLRYFYIRGIIPLHLEIEVPEMQFKGDMTLEAIL
jgi:hypothetical protein